MKNCEIVCGGASGDGPNTQHAVSRIFTRLPRYLPDKFMAQVSEQLKHGCPITFAQLSAFLQNRALVEKSFLGLLVNRRRDKTSTNSPRDQRQFGRKIGINTAQTTTGGRKYRCKSRALVARNRMRSGNAKDLAKRKRASVDGW